VPTSHGTWGQIMKVQVAKNGSVAFLDWSTSGLYRWPKALRGESVGGLDDFVADKRLGIGE